MPQIHGKSPDLDWVLYARDHAWQTSYFVNYLNALTQHRAEAC
jgi:REP element-mobilizing transposase RayT